MRRVVSRVRNRVAVLAVVASLAAAVPASPGLRADDGTPPPVKPAAPEAVAVDKEAPDFTLKDHAGHDFHLKDLRGERHVLLAFFPRAFTPG